MKATLVFILMVVTAVMLFATPCLAFGFGDIKGWITGEVLAGIVTLILSIVLGKIGWAQQKMKRTLKELGEFFDTLSKALEDDKIDRHELANIIKEGKDILAVW
jgi:hypothetical protein